MVFNIEKELFEEAKPKFNLKITFIPYLTLLMLSLILSNGLLEALPEYVN